jgi:quinol monooxygenase YgiN
MIQLHLRIRVANAKRDEFLAFLREAIPYYESPGGIRVRLLEDRSDSQRFIELVEYADDATYEADQVRVERDSLMKEYLARWRALLDGPPVLEAYRVR